MPTLTSVPDSLYIVPMGTLVYLANDPKLLAGSGMHSHFTNDHVDANIRGVFECKRRLYFTEDELVRKTPSIAVFALNPEDWNIAKFVVVGGNDIRLVHRSFSFKNYGNTTKGWQYPEYGRP